MSAITQITNETHAVDRDGNLLSDGVRTFTYDAANQLKTVLTNGVVVLTNFYDAKSRRVRKVTADATHTFFYDDWNLIEERVFYTNGTSTTIHYYWGKDLSGTLQSAGGVGVLLYLTIDNALYIPCYDNNGNITHYLDASGNIAVSYTYDAFGNTSSSTGSLSSLFPHRFSTKYYDPETGLYYYGYRFYHPSLMRWLTRDPLEEDGGLNLYLFCSNATCSSYDSLGLTQVSLSVNVEPHDSSFGYIDFIKITATIFELPKSGEINFIQLKKTNGQDWSVDHKSGIGPYYYSLFELREYSSVDMIGNRNLSLFDSPGGALSETVMFYTAVVEIQRSLCKSKTSALPLVESNDRVKVLASKRWSYNANATPRFNTGAMINENMHLVLKRLINTRRWNNGWDSNAKVEVYE